jgi:hypothetical protein
MAGTLCPSKQERPAWFRRGRLLIAAFRIGWAALLLSHSRISLSSPYSLWPAHLLVGGVHPV